MQYQKVTVTPELAKKYLARNPTNRPMRPGRVEYFADLIRRGAFLCTHQGVAVSPAGKLLDGQHRLAAIVETGISADMMVASDVDEETYIAFDRPASRSIADVLHIDVRKAHTLAFLVKMIVGKGAPAAPDQVDRLIKYVGPAVDKLLEVCPTNKTRVSAAPIKAAVVLRMMQMPADAQKIAETYKHFVSRDYDRIPRSVQAFLRQIDGSVSGVKVANAGASSVQLMARAWRAFNPETPNLQKIHFKDVTNVTEEIRSVFSHLVPHNVLTKAAPKVRAAKKDGKRKNGVVRAANQSFPRSTQSARV